MKKVLIGVGIGCGVLVLLGVVAMVAGGMWVSSKAEGWVAAGEELRAQDDTASTLNARFPFTPPADGEILALTQAGVDRWVEVVEQSRPQFTKLEAVFEETSNLGESLEGKGAGAALSELGKLGAQTKRVMEATHEARADLLTRLERAEMSPAEFTAISQTIITSMTTDQLAEVREGSAAFHTQLETSIKELEAKLADSATEEEREALQASLDAMVKAKRDMPGLQGAQGQDDVRTANAALVTPLRERFEDLTKTAALMMTISAGTGQASLNE